jgi:hypothetical protein
VGASKKDFFPKQIVSISNACKGFGHPARIIIMENLILGGEWICEDFLELIPLTRTTIWQHLQLLQNARLIQGKFKNNSTVYYINENQLKEIKNYFSSIKSSKL